MLSVLDDIDYFHNFRPEGVMYDILHFKDMSVVSRSIQERDDKKLRSINK